MVDICRHQRLTWVFEKRSRPWWGGLMLVVAALMGASEALATSVIDGRGVLVQVSHPPRRVVSLLPSLTEMVCAMALCDRLVGVDRYSNYPSRVRMLPKMGGGLDPDVEAVLALRPDLVLLATSSAAVARFEALGVPVMAIEPKTHADVRDGFAKLGRLFEVPDPLGPWKVIEAGMREAAHSVPVRHPTTTVYFEVNAAPYAASESSFIGQTLALLGVKNIVPAELGLFPKLNPEWVVRSEPDLIMVADSTASSLVERPGWSRLKAMSFGRVCLFTPEQSDLIVRPGPRMVEGAKLLAQCIREKAP